MGHVLSLFFRLLRVGEMTVGPSEKDYDPGVHLSISDIGLDHPRCPPPLCGSP